MPTVPVPLFQPVQRQADVVELNEENYAVYDGYRTASGGTTSRPGSKSLFTGNAATGIGIDGLHYWPEKSAVFAAGGGEVYQLSYVSNTPIITALTAGTPLLNTGTPVSFANDGTNVYVCNGGRIVYTPLSGTPAYINDPDAPTSATQIAYLDGYILAIDQTNKFYWSDVNAGTSWTSTSFASAAGSSDFNVALKVFNREIYLLGQKSIEVWENDGTTPFTRIPGGFIESGCSAAFSVLADENYLYWLDDNRRLVRFTGKSIERLSTKYDREFQRLARVSDCIAYKIPIDGYVFFVFTFPFDNKTFVYNQTVDDWSEWGAWDYPTALYNRYIGNCYTYAEKWGLHLIGRKDKRIVSQISRSYYQDDTDVIRVSRTTGHIDNGTLKTKRCDELRFRAKRGAGLSSGTPKIMIRYKLDNQRWSNVAEFSLGNVGEYDIVVRDRRRSIYKTKQYEFSATDAVDIVFSGAEEDIEVLR